MPFGITPKQANLPKKQVLRTENQKFVEPSMARVMNNDAFFTEGKISVTFLNRTSPVPVWVLDASVGKPEVGDFVVVGFLDGQKNSPYMAGIIAHKAYTSNFVRVEKDMIRFQFPLVATDVAGQDANDPKNHLRDDTQLSTRGYIQIDQNGITMHVPTGLAVNIQADHVNVVAHDGSGTPAAVARVGDTVNLTTGVITSGSSTLKSV